jgi:hypothetical protein
MVNVPGTHAVSTKNRQSRALETAVPRFPRVARSCEDPLSGALPHPMTSRSPVGRDRLRWWLASFNGRSGGLIAVSDYSATQTEQRI